MLAVHYRTKKLKKVCTNLEAARREYGSDMADKIHIDKIHIRIGQIEVAESVSELLCNGIGRCHKLEGDRRGQYAMDLVHPYRLIFTEESEKTVSVRIEQITDYH